MPISKDLWLAGSLRYICIYGTKYRLACNFVGMVHGVVLLVGIWIVVLDLRCVACGQLDSTWSDGAKSKMGYEL